MNIAKAGSTMAGHLHPLIIQPTTETVWTAGHFTSSDAFLRISIRAIVIRCAFFKCSLRRNQRCTGWNEAFLFYFHRERKEGAKGEGIVRGEMVQLM